MSKSHGCGRCTISAMPAVHYRCDALCAVSGQGGLPSHQWLALDSGTASGRAEPRKQIMKHTDSPELTFPFRRDGFLHELLEQDGPSCLVRRSKGGRQIHFEVVLLQWRTARTWPNGDFTPEGWHYPSSERWGTYGWTYTELAKARQKYDELCFKMAREAVT